MSENTPPEPKAPLFTVEELCAKANEVCKARNGQDLIKDDWDKAFRLLTKERNPWPKRLGEWMRTGEDGWNEKKPWDYLQLLLVPSALAIAGFWFQGFTKQQEQLAADNKTKQELQVADSKAKQETLTKYLDQMSDLLQKGLIKSKHGSDIFTIAQLKTAVTLQSLDPVRQHLVIQFLAAANLNGLDEGKGLLFQSRMSKAQLGKADLSFVKMIKADLSMAKLSGADLIGADLRGANFIGTDFSKANLPYASLIEAILFGADFRGAKLRGVLLMGSDLTSTKLDKKQLEQGEDSLLLCKVALPEEFKSEGITSDRDCDAMPQALLKEHPGEFKTLEDARTIVRTDFR